MESMYIIQEEIYEKMSKNKNILDKLPCQRLTVALIETHLENLERQWIVYNETHNAIIFQTKRDEYKNSEYYKNGCYDSTEELFLEFKTYLKEMLSNGERKISSSSGQVSQVKLPKIIIPQFSGKYTEWSSFKDLFTSLIHENNSLNNVQKLQYLKGHLYGEAEQLLRHISVTADNYATCWDLLNTRYDNKRFLTNQILNRLISQKNISLESPTQIKQLLDTTNECLNALTNLGINVSEWDLIVIHIICLKLDLESRKQWESEVCTKSSEGFPTLKEFKCFLTNRFRALENLDIQSNKSCPKELQTFHLAHYNEKEIICQFCSGSHKMSHCKEFMAQDCNSRYSFVQYNRFCFNCLGKHHLAKNCHNQNRCGICKKRHHSLLHKNSSMENVAGEIERKEIVYCEKIPIKTKKEIKSKNINSRFMHDENDRILLPTALIDVKSRSGSYSVGRSLLDQGSQVSLITKEMVQKLGLKNICSNNNITFVGCNKSLKSRSTVDVIIRSRVNPKVVIPVVAYVVESITELMPPVEVPAYDWGDTALADPHYFIPKEVNILLGADIYSQIIQNGIKKNSKAHLAAQLTSLGWIVSGSVQ